MLEVLLATHDIETVSNMFKAGEELKSYRILQANLAEDSMMSKKFREMVSLGESIQPATVASEPPPQIEVDAKGSVSQTASVSELAQDSDDEKCALPTSDKILDFDDVLASVLGSGLTGT